MYPREYYLSWWPDSSKILAYDGGEVLTDYQGGENNPFAGYSPFTLCEVTLNDANPKLALLKICNQFKQ